MKRLIYSQKWRISLTLGFLTILIWIGSHPTSSSGELALVQKRDCEEDLGKMGCSGITSSCDYVGTMVTCNCHANNCKFSKSKDEYQDFEDSDNGRNDLYISDSTSPNSKLGDRDRFSFKRKFEKILDLLRKDFRLRYGIEGIGTTNGFLRLGFCKLPRSNQRDDVCFFMHWFFESGFKQLNVRFGHKVTNSTAASV